MTQKESYKIAFEEKRNVLSKNESNYNLLRETFKRENTEIAEIDKTLRDIGAQIAIMAISGNKEGLNALREKSLELQDKKAQLLKNVNVPHMEYECEKCKDTGYINGKICDCIKRQARLIMLKSANRDLPIDECRFDNFDLSFYEGEDNRKMAAIYETALSFAKNFSNGNRQNLLFMGNTGLGKTHISLSIVGDILSRGFNVIYGSAYNLFSEMESEHFKLHTNEKYEAAIECDLLVIDDLGAEFSSPYIQTLVYNIVNTRLLSGKSTVINTNLSMKEIEERYTPRVASRLMGSYTAKKFCGSDIRQIKFIKNL